MGVAMLMLSMCGGDCYGHMYMYSLDWYMYMYSLDWYMYMYSLDWYMYVHV